MKNPWNSASLGVALFAFGLAPVSATIVTLGDTDPPFDNGGQDGWDAIFIFTTAMAEPNPAETLGQVVQLEFWADTPTNGRDITPLLYSSSDGGVTHEVIGVGTTYTIGSDGTAADGVNAVDFGLTDGTDTFDTTTPGETYYVGFHTTDSNGNAASDGGVVPFAGGGGGPNLLWQTETVPTVGQDPSVGASASFTSNRQYAYNVDIDFQPNIPVLDADGDGLPDDFEQQIIDADPNDAITSFADVLPGGDFDGDDSTNEEEKDRRTDPTDPDSDGDTIPDGHETKTGIYQSSTDTGTDPLSADTDNDGLNDGIENNSGIFNSTSDTGTDPNDSDTDNDGLRDGVENNDGAFVDADMTGTDPHDPDSDNDFSLDGEEVNALTDPNDPNEGGKNGLIAGQQTVAVDQDSADGWAVCYIDEERPFRLGGGTSAAIEFNFYASSASIGLGGRVTPFVAEVLTPNSFLVRAIGTTRIEGVDWTLGGLQSFPFNDDGGPEVQDGWVAGFITSDPDGSNPSNQIVPFVGGRGIDGWLAGSPGPADPGGIAIGLAPEDGTGASSNDAYGERDYSFQIVAGRGAPKMPIRIESSGSELVIKWDSQAGLLYNLRSSTTLDTDPAGWDIWNLNENIEATPSENSLTIPRPADTERFFVIEEFPAPPEVQFADNFENGQGGWTVGSDNAAGTAWEFGAPTNVGPAAANSPDNCFGTNLGSDYALSAEVWLRSPPIDLTAAAGATLNYFEWRDIEVMFDSGRVTILDAADDSEIAEIEDSIDGASVGWEKVTRPIPAAALGNMIKIEWRLTSDDFTNLAGWYIDDVEVTIP